MCYVPPGRGAAPLDRAALAFWRRLVQPAARPGAGAARGGTTFGQQPALSPPRARPAGPLHSLLQNLCVMDNFNDQGAVQSREHEQYHACHREAVGTNFTPTHGETKNIYCSCSQHPHRKAATSYCRPIHRSHSVAARGGYRRHTWRRNPTGAASAARAAGWQPSGSGLRFTQ